MGGEPIEVTVEGRERFTINVRYPASLRQDVERLRQVLVPIHRAGNNGGSMGSGRTMGLLPGADGTPGATPALDPARLLASNGWNDFDADMGSMDRRAPGMSRSEEHTSELQSLR